MFHDSSRTTGGPGSYVASCAGGFVLALGLFEAQRDFVENNSSSSRVLFSLYRRCSYSLRFGPRASATTSELGHRAPMPVRRSHGICLVSRWSRLRDEPTHQLYEQASAVVQQSAMEQATSRNSLLKVCGLDRVRMRCCTSRPRTQFLVNIQVLRTSRRARRV